MSPPIIVSGFGRCGSSLVMQMLRAGGFPVTGQWPAFEDDRMMPVREVDNAVDLTPFAGKAVKILDPHRFTIASPLPPRAIWLDRNHREQAKSHVKFLRLVLGLQPPANAAKLFADSYKKDRDDALAALFRVSEGVQAMAFEHILANPANAARVLCRIVQRDLDLEAMAQTVIRRKASCYPGLLELEMAGKRELAP